MPSRSHVPPLFDHVVIATPDLESTVSDVANTTGVQPEGGGVHPQFGTRNFLLSFGETDYLEIIGADAENPDFEGTRPFNLNTITEAVVSTWVIHPRDITGAVAASRTAGLDIGDPYLGQRESGDGKLIEWHLTPPLAEPTGIVPFLIDWGQTPSPATTTVGRADLVSLHATHPDPNRFTPILDAIGTELPVFEGEPGLHITIAGPAGELTIGSRQPTNS